MVESGERPMDDAEVEAGEKAIHKPKDRAIHKPKDKAVRLPRDKAAPPPEDERPETDTTKGPGDGDEVAAS